ncbi:uncharacterized protein TNCT_79461 [Trichonephila clavata]|uniref:Uncharacterized protein n=1 Tax=Trichonephila clavata TaxID=2740835 RepID=A0A8X6FGZ1_TRICU|nr:uncharacterized protein TNCT_79461 [Trichonephila clavata]
MRPPTLDNEQWSAYDSLIPSLMAAQKREKPSALPETILTVPTLDIDESPTPEVTAGIQVSLSNEDDTKQELSENEDPLIVTQAPSSESEPKIELNQPHPFWPASDGIKEEVKELTDGNCQRSVISVEEAVDALFDRIEHRSIQMETSMDDQKLQQQQRPIEDILQALDQLVAPREVEISIDWDARGPINIREKTVLPSNASDPGSTLDETDGLTEDRKRCIETLLKEVDECLRVNRVNNDHWTIGRGGDNPKGLRGGSIDYQRRRQNLLLLGGAFIPRVSGTLKCRSNGTEGLSTPHDGTSFSTQLPPMSNFFKETDSWGESFEVTNGHVTLVFFSPCLLLYGVTHRGARDGMKEFIWILSLSARVSG